MIRSPKRKIRYLKTNTGENYSVTISRKCADAFSGCVLYETVLSDGILLCVSGNIIEKDLSLPPSRIYFNKVKE